MESEPREVRSGEPMNETAAVRLCPVCGSRQVQEIRAKIVCMTCKVIIETCCEGGRG